MKQPTLYLLVGYPGSGKTTTSLLLSSLTGGVHIWADHERRAMFGTPTHSPEENRQLYGYLNQKTSELLASGKSVIFDTNFNFRRDRFRLSKIAADNGAITRIIWIKVDRQLALERAQHERHAAINKYSYQLPAAEFERMAGNLQPPEPDEKPIILDGTLITPEYIADKLRIPLDQVSTA